MKAFDILTNEHGLIRHFLDNMGMAAQKIEEGQTPPAAFFENGVEFARRFADKYHHHKEEYVMFTRLAQTAGGEIDDQIQSLRHQHERSRECISTIAESLSGYEAGDSIKTGNLLEAVSAYVSLLRHHIHTEDHVFYPMAKEALSEEDQAALVEEFNKDSAKFGAETFQECHKLVVDMGSMLVHL